MVRSLVDDLRDARANAQAEAVRRRRDRSPWLGRKFESDEDERAAILRALELWGQMTGGEAPARADWTSGRDPDAHWPRADRVSELFRFCDCAFSRAPQMIQVPITINEAELDPALRGSVEWIEDHAWVPNPDHSRECLCPSGWQRSITAANLAAPTGRNRTLRSELARYGDGHRRHIRRSSGAVVASGKWRRADPFGRRMKLLAGRRR